MRKWTWGPWLLGALGRVAMPGMMLGIMLWAGPASAADVALGADVDALYFWKDDRVGVGINVYPGVDGGGGLTGELQLGYELAHSADVQAVYPIYVGVRYDFADLIESNDWHPILAAHAGVSVMQVYTAPLMNVNSGTGVVAQGGGESSSRPSSTNSGLGSNVAVGLNYSSSNERAVGVILQQNWAGAGNGATASWISLGVAVRMVF